MSGYGEPFIEASMLSLHSRPIRGHIFNQIRDRVSLGREAEGIKRETRRGLRIHACRMVHEIRFKASFFDLVDGHVTSQLMNDGADHFQMREFLRTNIRKRGDRLVKRHGITL